MKRIKTFLITCIFSVCITQTSFAVNIKNNNLVKNDSVCISSSNDSNLQNKELVTDGICNYYFYDTTLFTISICHNFMTGYYETYLKDKSTDYMYIKSSYNKNLKGTISEYEKLSKNEFNNTCGKTNVNIVSSNVKKISLSKFKLQKGINKNNVHGDNGAPGEPPSTTKRLNESTIAKYIDTELIKEYGNPYSNIISSQSFEYGNSGMEKTSKNFYRTKKISWLINAGSSIGLVMSIMSIKAATAKAIFFTVVSAASGIVSIANDCTSGDYIANVNYNKSVWVNNRAMGGAGKTISGIAHVGDKGASYSKGSTRQHPQYDNLLSSAMLKYAERYN